MEILVIGGTKFVGRHFVELALQRGHEITLFNRGKTADNLFTDVDYVCGDRFHDIHRLKGMKFDAIFDPTGYFPGNMDYVTSRLKDQTDHYVFVSSCSVFDNSYQLEDSITEKGQLVDLDIDQECDSPETYGARKYLCEQVVKRCFTDRQLIVRPGLIVGSYDHSYRFPYWADRIAEGGRILCPGSPGAPLQFIDVRDLSNWILGAMEAGYTGTYNAVSPHDQLTLGQFLETVREEVSPKSDLEWVDEGFLRSQEISCWTTLPLWLFKELQGFMKVNSNKALSKGLTFRDIRETIRDTHKWSREVYQNGYLQKVLSRKNEQELLGKF